MRDSHRAPATIYLRDNPLLKEPLQPEHTAPTEGSIALSIVFLPVLPI